MKNGASDPLITNNYQVLWPLAADKNRKEWGGFVPAGTIISAQSLWCLWVGKLSHFWWWTVSEVNWLCRQAGLADKQSIYLDVYG